MKFVRSLHVKCLLMFLAAATTAVAQRRSPSASSLLWKISGNGLERPSYLYGTMHVEHKDVFAFADSVLAKLQECSAFASEAHLDSFARAYLERYFHNEAASDTEEEDKEEATDSRSSEEQSDQLHNRGLEYSLPSRDSWSRRLRSGTSNDPNSDGPVFLDAWFFNLAKNLSKHTLGVETLTEQFAMLDADALDDLEPAGMNIFSAIRAQRDLVQYYKEGRVDKLETLLRETLPAEQFDRMLTRRNHVMAERIARQIAVEQTFVAIGAGHLGGKEGVITLLRKQGFTVSPIIPTYTGAADRFIFPKGHSQWFEFHHREGAFSIDVPIEPVQYPVDTNNVDPRKEDPHNFHYWVSPDIGGGLYFSFSYNDNTSWGDVVTPSATLDKAVAHYLKSFPGTIVRSEMIDVYGFPGRDLEVSTEPRTGYRIRFCLRGPRLYTMMVAGSKRILHGDLPGEFLHSFTIEDYDPITWQRFVSEEEGFGADLPGIPITSLDTLYVPANIVVRSYHSRNRNNGQSYHMQAAHYSEYHQSESPDAFFKRLAELWTSGGEAVIRDSTMRMMGFRGSDILVRDTASGVMSHIRAVLRGNILYQVWSTLPAIGGDSNAAAHFIESFHLLEHPVLGDLFSPKIDRLFEGLKSDEPEQRSRARAELRIFPFTEEDLPRIYNGIDQQWVDEGASVNSWATTEQLLLRALGTLKSASSINVLRDLYSRADPEKIDMRTTILEVLAKIGSVGSRETLLDLLLQSKERHEKCEFNIYQLADSLPAIGHLFPRILELADIPDYRPALFWISRMLVDSGFVRPEIIGSEHLLDLCRDAIRTYLKPKEIDEFSKDTTGNDPFEAVAAIRLLGSLGSNEETIRLVALTLDGTDPAVVLPATILLLQNNQPVPSASLERIAANSLYCLDLYRQLSDIKKLDLFPETYRTQRHFAECLLVEWLTSNEDTAPQEIRYIAQKDVDVDDERGRVFLFKFRYEDGTWYAGIAGPQPVDRQKVATSPGITRSAYRDFDDLSIKDHFTILLEKH